MESAQAMFNTPTIPIDYWIPWPCHNMTTTAGTNTTRLPRLTSLPTLGQLRLRGGGPCLTRRDSASVAFHLCLRTIRPFSQAWRMLIVLEVYHPLNKRAYYRPDGTGVTSVCSSIFILSRLG